VVGTSRKSFIGKLTGREVDARLGGTIASNVLAAVAGADVIRGHDALELRQALDVAEVILGRRDWRGGSVTAASAG
jgi:dihydropteroate synthase